MFYKAARQLICSIRVLGSNNSRHTTLTPSPGCAGVTKDEQGKYHLHHGHSLIQDQGYITYLIGGESVTSQGYLWDYHHGATLRGYDSNTQYRTATDALSACIRSKTCVGVTQEHPNSFRLNTHRIPRPHGGRTCWIKGNQQVKAHCECLRCLIFVHQFWGSKSTI